MASEFNGGVKLAPVDDASRARGATATIGRSSIVIFALILLSVGAFFGLMLVASEAGWRIGRARLAGTAGALAKGAGSAEAAVFGLFGLLVAFTFSGAAQRFEARRHLIAEEANTIGTAYLRLDLLPRDAQPGVRELFGKYVDNRYAVYRQAQDSASTEAKLAETASLQSAIWDMTFSALKEQGLPTPGTTLLLGSLNEMIDITETRRMATITHPPPIIFVVLGLLSLVCAALVGYDTSDNTARSWLHSVTFAAVVSLTVYVIVDVEFPRLGLIRVDSADAAIFNLREIM